MANGRQGAMLQRCRGPLAQGLPWPSPSLTSPEDVDKANQDPQGQDGIAGFNAAGAADVAEEGVAAVDGGSRNAEVNPSTGANGRAAFGDGLARLATDSHSDIRCHTVFFILCTLDRCQAGPVGGCIRARKADERVGCKEKAHLSKGPVERYPCCGSHLQHSEPIAPSHSPRLLC